MYSYDWDKRTGGYRLLTTTGKFVAAEIRPVFADELILCGFDARLKFDVAEQRPLLWAKKNTFWYRGEEIARLNKTQYGKPISIDWRGSLADGGKATSKKKNLTAVNIEAMIEKNRVLMDALVADTLKRIKEMYDAYADKCDVVYIGFSGGKDSVVLLDLCHQVLPMDVPVVFSDTDMELPDTYKVWEDVQKRYPERTFIKATAHNSAIDNWHLFGPPSQALRWCCSVHKSAPALLELKQRHGKPSIKATAFLGIRSEESLRRSNYDDVGDGLKSTSQINTMPLLNWSAHELWLYIFDNNLVLNDAYRKGLPRVGCLLCPMSSDRQNDLIRRLYPQEVNPFVDAVKQTIDRQFETSEDEESFIFQGGWYARKNGRALKGMIEVPVIDRKKDRITCEFPLEREDSLREWLKAVGKIKNAELAIRKNEKRGVLECIWENGKADRVVMKWLTYAVFKTIACAGCKVCEAECPTGALRININNDNTASIRIDESTCVHCMRCYSPDEGCCLYHSKRYAGAKTMNITGIAKYQTFGLKPEWIEVLSSERESFRQTGALGTRMIPSAIAWFREAGLTTDSSVIATTKLIEVGENSGFHDLLLWQLMWTNLCNTSPLVKWYVCNAPFDAGISPKELDEILEPSTPSASSRKSALSSLNQLIKSSPLCEGDALVEVEMKGRTVKKLTRRARSVDSLIILYGLYVMTEVSGHAAFTVRQMMEADFEGACISPLVAFGISPDEFKKQCLGLATQYPEFISCSFTLGLDEVRVFADKKCRDDVVALILER